MQRKSVRVYGILCSAQKAVQGHAPGTGDALQNSKEAQGKKSSGIKAITLPLTEDSLEPKNKTIQREARAGGSVHATGTGAKRWW